MEPVEDSRSPAAPAGLVIYAIGDVHGRRDLLNGVLDRLREAAREARPVAIFLGDYVDRGPASRGVIEDLIAFCAEGTCRTIFLRGNHEQVMLDVLDGKDDGRGWLRHGGLATLESYGAAWAPRDADRDLQGLLKSALPPAHVEFLRATTLSARYGDYVFVHAGLRPDRLIEEQSPSDILWFRFYDDAPPLHSAFVVHGHSPNPVPVLSRHRAGIDTGAYASGALTMLRLEGTRKTFERIAVSQNAPNPVLSEWAKLDSAYRAAPRPGRVHGRLGWEFDDAAAPGRGSRRLAAIAAVIGVAALALAGAFLFGSASPPGPDAAARDGVGETASTPFNDG